MPQLDRGVRAGNGEPLPVGRQLQCLDPARYPFDKPTPMDQHHINQLRAWLKMCWARVDGSTVKFGEWSKKIKNHHNFGLGNLAVFCRPDVNRESSQKLDFL